MSSEFKRDRDNFVRYATNRQSKRIPPNVAIVQLQRKGLKARTPAAKSVIAGIMAVFVLATMV